MKQGEKGPLSHDQHLPENPDRSADDRSADGAARQADPAFLTVF